MKLTRGVERDGEVLTAADVNDVVVLDPLDSLGVAERAAVAVAELTVGVAVGIAHRCNVPREELFLDRNHRNVRLTGRDLDGRNVGLRQKVGVDLRGRAGAECEQPGLLGDESGLVVVVVVVAALRQRRRPTETRAERRRAVAVGSHATVGRRPSPGRCDA